MVGEAAKKAGYAVKAYHGTAFVLTEKAEPTRARSALLGNDKAISSAYVEIISQREEIVKGCFPFGFDKGTGVSIIHSSIRRLADTIIVLL